jgi:hypothetical protein
MQVTGAGLLSLYGRIREEDFYALGRDVDASYKRAEYWEMIQIRTQLKHDED